MQECKQITCGDIASAKGESDAVSYEGIDKSGGVSCVEDAARNRDRLAQNHRKRGDRRKDDAPAPATSCEERMAIQNFFERCRDTWANQGAGIEQS